MDTNSASVPYIKPLDMFEIIILVGLGIFGMTIKAELHVEN